MSAIDDALKAAPAVVQLVGLGADLLKVWTMGNADDKAAAETKAQAAIAAMDSIAAETAAAHALRIENVQAEIDKAEGK